MRLFLLSALALSTLCTTAQAKKFTLSVNLAGKKEISKIYLTHKYDNKTIVDSADFKDGKANFKGTTPEPNMYWITLNRNADPSLIFFIDEGKNEINGHLDSMANARVKAGKTQEDYKAFQAMSTKFNAEKTNFIKKFNVYRSLSDQNGQKKIQDSAYWNERAFVKNMYAFIKAHPKSNVSGFMIFSTVFDWPSIPEYDSLYSVLGSEVKKGKFGKLAAEKINSIKGTTIGYPALDFKQADVNGKEVSLSSFKGKVVLVDFWASWCGPCRAENPNVVAAYKKYKDKGFDIFGVSLDENKDRWMRAIEKDGLTWQHVSDLKGWQNEAAKAYGVSSIPFNLLLDKDGKILAKGLRGADLEAKLAEIFGE